MADGDVVLDRSFEIDAQEGTHVELFAVENSSYPGGYYYRFQYYNPEEGEQILRYDNAHDSNVGPHHRHVGDDVTGIEFGGLQDHVARFKQEVLQINARR
ncbi:toxin-antitoxin system TumE family protein [Natrialbaceae archaeon A-gly3]